MQLRERLASSLIGSPLQGAAERLRWVLQAPHRARHPELREIHLEGRRIRQLLEALITDGMNCVDVGCHLGSVLQEFLRLSPNGRHVAIEPLPYKATWLRRKFPAVEVFQTALGDVEGTVEFFYSKRRSGYSGLRAHDPVGPIEKLSVPCRRLDDIVHAERTVGFLKVDVEGGEYAVLRGGQAMIQRDRPVILFECTRSGLSSFGYTARQIYSLLAEDLGYRIFLIKDRLAGGSPLSLADFEAAMTYPFMGFNFVASPATV
jgi:FkbM family methyltransferase